MDVILDTNVLLGALISPKGYPHIIYQHWRRDQFSLVTSLLQIDELKRASQYPKLKKLVPAHRFGSVVNFLQHGNVLEQLPRVPKAYEARDPFDNFLIAMVIASNADYLVTGDRKSGLLEFGSIGRTRVATPALFCKEALKIELN